MYFGFNFPFVGGASNFFSPQFDERLIKNDIISLLLIAPEEIPYTMVGTKIRALIFEQLTDSDLSRVSAELRSQIEANDARVVVRDVRLSLGSDNQLNIMISFSIRQAPLTKYLIEISIDKNGELNIL